MSDETLPSAAWLAAWKPRDKRTVGDWSAEFVTVPGAARSGGKFDPAYCPWITKGPLAALQDASIREIVAVMPTGAGKTTVFDCGVPYIAAETPGDILLLMQTNPDASGHMETRVIPTLRDCEPLKEIIAGMGRHSIRKDALIMPHMNFYCRGANQTNVQRISVVYVFIDEAWLVDHGLIEEARARTHARWNRKVVIVSQGGNESVNLHTEQRETELFSAFKRTDRNEFAMVCPGCGAVTPWDFKWLKWDDAETPDGGIDEAAISKSVRYTCPNCPIELKDDPITRRALVDSSVYVPTNPNPWVDARGGRYVGYHCHGLAIPHEPWGDYAVNYKRAVAARRNGDNEPLKTMVTKRFALFWKDDEDAPNMVLGASGYSKGDYLEGELWEGEIRRCMTIDRQRDHFWTIVRAFRPDGSSRLLFEGKVLTILSVREVQKRYKVEDYFTFQDAGHDTGDVYDDCVRYGWVALLGSGKDEFPHRLKNGRIVNKFFSPIGNAVAPMGGRARYIFWSNGKVKDMLVQFRAGRGPGWQAPDDVSPDYLAQICSEVKRTVINKTTKQPSERYVRIGKRDNHLWDCEAMALVFALIKEVIGHREVAVGRDQDPDPDESPDPAR